MKKTLLASLVMLSVLFMASCCTVKVQAQPEQVQKKLKVGFYIDDGSRSGGVLRLGRLIGHTPQFELVLLDGKDLRDGKLANVDMLLIPGGSSQKQYEAMQESGAQAVRDFVSKGGAYFGVCAGFHCAMNCPERIKLLPFKHKSGSGHQGNAAVEISAEGAKLLGVKKGIIYGRYSKGPIAIKENDWPHSSAKTLAVYKSTITKAGVETNGMFNASAIIYGNHGKGKVVATSFHPESYNSTSDIVFGCINLVTGVRGKMVLPVKNRRPVRTLFYATSLRGKAYMPIFLALDRNADIDVVPGIGSDIDAGALEHADVLVIPPGNGKVIRSGLLSRKALLKNFMDRGGVIISRQAEFKDIIDHKNVVIVPEGKCFVPYALQAR